MQVVMIMSIFWIFYGIAGLFGIQNIPNKYKGYIWTKDYKRCQGISWLMVGIPWFVVYLVVTLYHPSVHIDVIIWTIIFLAIPSIVYTVIWGKKFNELLNKERNSN